MFLFFSSVLSFDIISYLTYEGLNLCEQLEVIRLQKGDINSCLRRIHLVIEITFITIKF